jgi:hypothetical protein
MITVAATTIINVTAGETQYVGGTITEVNGKNITADTFEVALSTTAYAPVTGWRSALVNIQGPTVADRTLLLLVDSTTPVGTYSMWARVTDVSERPVRCLHSSIVVR